MKTGTIRFGGRFARRVVFCLFGFASCMTSVMAQSSAVATPSATRGPYYPEASMRFRDVDNDLLRISDGRIDRAKGIPFTLKGRLLDMAGKPLAGGRIEIWQTDANGRYIHTDDDGETLRDPGFQGYGTTITDSEGRFSFRTIKPTAYPGRTPHIHVKIRHRKKGLITQLYIADHESNRRDGLFRRMSAEEQNAVSLRFNEGGQGLESRLDIRLER
ncbi:PcaH Protocatechuate 3,4-dioxygenase beta subunit [Rhabdaerophilaceae bacterium]